MITYHTIIIGLGAMGSATLYQLAKQGAHVLGLDRHNPPHEFGSSHAESRVTRLAVGEGPQYLPLVARSHEIWRELEAATGRPLLYQPGGYIITPQNPADNAIGHWNNFVQRTADIAQQAHIPYHITPPAAIRAKHPHILIQDHELAGFEPSGGVVLSEAAVATQLQLAQQHGATIHTNEPVTNISWTADAVTVTTANNTYTAAHAIISAGAWVRDFLPDHQRPKFRVTRQVVYWFEPQDPAVFSASHFPFVLWVGETLADYLGVFPIPPNGIPGVKLLTEQYTDTTNPANVNRTVSPAEIDHFYHTLASRKLSGLTPHCLKATVCLYTHTPDDHFIIDHPPDTDRITVISACSSHGFKHSAAIGEAVAQQTLNGRSQIDLSPFTFGRIANKTFE